MGADLYIESLYEENQRKWQLVFDAACKERDSHRQGTKIWERHQRKVEKAHSNLMSEGYFRDPYNAESLFQSLGLSWWRDVGALLENQEGPTLSGPDLLKFKTMVESATPAWEDDQAWAAHKDRNKLKEEGTITWKRYFIQKRQELLDFIQQAIDLGEPIYFSI